MSVKRYEIDYYPVDGSGGRVVENVDGDYVLYADYAALEAEVAGLRGVVDGFKVALSIADRDLRAYIGIATKCAALEALLRRASKDLAMWNMGLANEINAALTQPEQDDE